MATGTTITLGDLLRRHRLAAGLSQEALAERAGLSATAIAALERGRRKMPRPDTMALLARALGLSAEERAALVALGTGQGLLSADTAPAPPPVSPSPERMARPLPLPPTPLIGREREEAAVIHLLQPGAEHGRLVTLTGPGGVGKTRLALAVAAALQPLYADGVVFVDLSALRDPLLVAPAIARSIGVREEGALSARDLLLAFVHDKQMLLVLDNLEQVVEAAAMVSDLIVASPRLAVLTTSRVSLRVRAEQRFDVPPLDVPDAGAPAMDGGERYPAVQLFVARARAVQGDFALDAPATAAVAEICRRLDGVPLAIELAAARVALLPPVQLLGRLERRLSLLRDGPRDLPARQHTLRATIDWSYALLPQPERILFRRLCIFAGGFTLDAAEAVAASLPPESDDGSVFGSLASLVDHSLLRLVEHDAPPDEPRFRLLETVREFGLEQSADSGEEEAIRQAHAAYYLALAETAKLHLFGPDQVRWLDRLEQEGDNLRAALAGAREHGDVEHGVRLAGALWRFWYIRCHLSEGHDWLREFVRRSAEEARRGTNQSARVDALVGLAVIAYAQTAYDRAAVAAEEAVAAARALDDRENLAVALNILAGVARYQSNLTRAEALGEECVTVACSLGDHWTQALSLHNLADATRLQGRYDRAAELAGESLAISRALGDRWGIAQALLMLGRIGRDRGDAAAARELFAESLAIVRALGHTRDIALALTGLGRVALAQGDHEQAVARLEESLALLRPLGDQIRTADVLAALAHAWRARGEHARAVDLHKESLAVVRAVRAALGVAENLEGLAAALLAGKRQAEQAARLLGAAAALRDTAGMPLPPADRGEYERAARDARVMLGDGRFSAAWSAGAALRPDQVVDDLLAAAAG